MPLPWTQARYDPPAEPEDDSLMSCPRCRFCPSESCEVCDGAGEITPERFAEIYGKDVVDD